MITAFMTNAQNSPSTSSLWLPLRAAGMAMLLGIAFTGAAEAQYFRGFYAHGPVLYPPAFVPQPGPVARPGFVLASLSARGYDVIGIAGRRGDVLIVDVMSPRDERLRLIVDAFDGEILERFAGSSARGAQTIRPQVSPRNGENAQRRDVSRDPAASRKGPEKVAELPVPPKRPVSTGALPAPTVKLAPAPRRLDDWAPINSVPVAPLD